MKVNCVFSRLVCQGVVQHAFTKQNKKEREKKEEKRGKEVTDVSYKLL